MPPELRVDESHHVGQVLATTPDSHILAVNDHPILVTRHGGDGQSYMTYKSERGARIGLMRCTVSGLPTAKIIEREEREPA